jgi:hypothetical protein
MMLAAMRERVPRLIKTLVCYIRGLIVEHNIDRVRGLSLQVTVMNQDNILMASTLDQARADERVEDFHRSRGEARDRPPLLLRLSESMPSMARATSSTTPRLKCARPVCHEGPAQALLTKLDYRMKTMCYLNNGKHGEHGSQNEG